MTLRVGVVGLRFGALVHIPAFQSEGVEVVAVCSRRTEHAKEVAERYGIARVCSEPEELVSLAEVDAVSVVTPPPLHAPVALAALRAGKHVLCEKPMSVDLDSARAMRDLADASGLTAMMGLEFRYCAPRARAKELIDDGYIGTLRLAVQRVLISRAFPLVPGEPPEFEEARDAAGAGAGGLASAGSHYIDGLRHFFGDIDAVFGAHLETFRPERRHGGKIVDADADDTFSANLSFSAGGLAQLLISQSLAFSATATTELYGSEGTLVLPQSGRNPPARGRLLGARLGDEGLCELEIPERLAPFEDPRDDRLMPFRLLVRDFVEGIEEKRSPSPSFADGCATQAVIEAVRKAARSGGRVLVSA